MAPGLGLSHVGNVRDPCGHDPAMAKMLTCALMLSSCRQPVPRIMFQLTVLPAHGRSTFCVHIDPNAVLSLRLDGEVQVCDASC